jgi:dolichyl-phosphate beta-glucosyltransferase
VPAEASYPRAVAQMNPDPEAATASIPAPCPEYFETFSTSTSTSAGASPGRAVSVERSLVVPAFNEAARLREGLSRLSDAVAEGAIDLETTEIVFVDDGSADDTASLARQLLAHAPHVRILRLARHAGKGASVRVGVAEAKGARVAFTDADMAILPTQLPALYGALDRADVAIGCRELPGSSVDSSSLLRSLGGRGFNRMVNLVTKADLTDTQCGFKAFRTPAARLLFHYSVIDGFAFDVEVLYGARRLGLGIAEVPVRWLRIEGSRIHPLRDPVRMLSDVAKVRLGLRRPPPVPALVLGGEGPSVADVRGVLGPEVPVLRRPSGDVMVLMALQGASSCDEVRKLLSDRWPDASVQTTTVTASALEKLAPLGITTD